MGVLNGFEGLKKVVLIHGHDDHTDGLSCVLTNSSADILIHEKAFLPKYVLRNGNLKFIGTRGEYDTDNSCLQINDVNETIYTSKIEFISEITEIAANIFIFRNFIEQ